MQWWQAILLGAFLIAAVYVGAWVSSRAFFDNKAEYNRRLLRQLEEKSDAEKES